MLAARLLLSNPSLNFSRNFATRFARAAGRTKTSTTPKGKSFWSVFTRPATGRAFAIGHYAGMAGGALGLGALVYYGLTQSSEATGFQRMSLWTETVRSRVRTTYGYVAGSIFAAVGSASFACRSRFVMEKLGRGGLIPFFVCLGALMLTSGIARSIEYKEGFGAKQLAWLGFCCTLGVIVAPLAAVGGPILYRAGLYTAGIVGGLSTVAMAAPSEKFLNTGGILGIGCGFLLVSCIGSAFLGPQTAIGSALHAVVLYGGLLLFSGFTLYDTQKITKAAETHPVYANPPFDPVNHSMSLFMDIVNIFVRMVQIFAMSGGKKK